MFTQFVIGSHLVAHPRSHQFTIRDLMGHVYVDNQQQKCNSNVTVSGDGKNIEDYRSYSREEREAVENEKKRG